MRIKGKSGVALCPKGRLREEQDQFVDMDVTNRRDFGEVLTAGPAENLSAKCTSATCFLRSFRPRSHVYVAPAPAGTARCTKTGRAVLRGLEASEIVDHMSPLGQDKNGGTRSAQTNINDKI